MALSGMNSNSVGGGSPGGAARQVARVVLDAVADAGCLQHFEVEVGALFQPLGFQELAFGNQLVEALFQLFLDADDGLVHGRLGVT